MSRRGRRRGVGLGVLGAVLILASGAALAGLAAAAFLLRPPPIDAESLCRTDAPLAAHTIILVDATDRFEPRHRRKLRAVLAQERARLSQYERLTLMRLNARRPQEPSILFSKCLPRPPEQTNPLFENARDIEARWNEAFGARLDQALRSAQAGGAQRASPLLAGLRAAAADPDFGPEIARRRLVLVSDLLEHDPNGFSLYAAGADYARWRAQSPTPAPDLTSVAVRLVPLDRPDHAARQADALALFWPAYFDAAAIHSLEIDPAP